jgi:hypothetical protein
MDLNGDGRQDLVVFDKIGPRITTYVDQNSSGAADYKYAPEYRKSFPIGLEPGFEEDWLLLRDFNCDGKKDIFAGYSGRVKVYENTSNGGQLSFTKAHPDDALQGQILSGKLNLHVPKTDIPGIIDLDNDGDLDIITFGGSVAYVEWWENKQNCGLDFERRENCWGHFLESGITNELMLDTCTPFKAKAKSFSSNSSSKTLHAGGTLLPLDLNGDGIKELLIGDVSFKGITALFNTGTAVDAFFSSQDTAFPSYNQSISLDRFPSCFYEDADGDGVKDLLVSSNQTGITGSENYKSIHLYKNNGTNNMPDFAYVKDNFLQEDQLDLGEGCVPRFVDLNGDSLQDIVLSNVYYFSPNGNPLTTFTYLENSGTKTDPEFTLIDSNFLDVSSFGLGIQPVPTFGDLDNDNDLDMIIGDANGKIHLFTNNGSASSPSFSLTTAGLANLDVGSFASPYLFDMDSNGTLDLLIGNEKGTVYYYTNSSNTNPNFTYVTDFFGGIDVSHPYLPGAYSSPYVFENNGLINVMVGSSSGVYQYDSINKVVNLPNLLTGILGTENLVSSDFNESPYGFNKFTGRNQILYKASELKAAGLSFGFITKMAFFDPDGTSNEIVQNGMTVKMKNTTATDLSSFETGLTEVFDTRFLQSPNTWTDMDLTDPFLWDGESNIVVEICFSGNSFRQAVNKVEMSNTSYISNAWGDVDNNNNIAANGCSLPLAGSAMKRPNARFTIKPAFENTDHFLKDGFRNAAAFTDIDADGFMDVLLGNYSGGAVFYRGEVYDISVDEPFTIESSQLAVYPNPGEGLFKVQTENRGNSAQLTVYDLTGRMIQTLSVNEDVTEVNLDNESEGMYIFVLQDGENVFTQKVIKD